MSDAPAALGALAGAALVRVLGVTWRFRKFPVDPAVVPGAGGEGRIFAFWHAQMLPLLLLHRSLGVNVLISEHRDGERIARVAQRLGYGTIRGSSRRGAANALRGLERALAAGEDVAVTPDGPRGPAEEFAPGALIAARLTGAPVVLVAAAPDRAWRLKTWDGFVVPKPFARIRVAYSEALRVEGASARDAAAQTLRFQEMLRALNDTAQRS